MYFWCRVASVFDCVLAHANFTYLHLDRTTKQTDGDTHSTDMKLLKALQLTFYNNDILIHKISRFKCTFFYVHSC